MYHNGSQIKIAYTIEEIHNAAAPRTCGQTCGQCGGATHRRPSTSCYHLDPRAC